MFLDMIKKDIIDEEIFSRQVKVDESKNSVFWAH